VTRRLLNPKRVTIRLTEKQYAYVRQRATETGTSMAAVIRAAIDADLEAATRDQAQSL
jgi:predicted DNA binding CopG/RHH family protein